MSNTSSNPSTSTITSTSTSFEFRPGTCDENVYRSVVELNEYRLPDKFDVSDVIFDVGAHIGSFAKACIDRGAGKVYAFEPDFENFMQIRKNLANEIKKGRVVLLPVGVWRSDKDARLLYQTGWSIDAGEINTGSGDLIHSKPGDTIIPVFPLDRLINGLATPGSPLYGWIRLLKLDCEYSEWPILWTMREFGRVRAICGEYHETKRLPDFARLNESHTYDRASLTARLESQDYNVETRPHEGSNLGLFWAWQMGFEFRNMSKESRNAGS